LQRVISFDDPQSPRLRPPHRSLRELGDARRRRPYPSGAVPAVSPWSATAASYRQRHEGLVNSAWRPATRSLRELFVWPPCWAWSGVILAYAYPMYRHLSMERFGSRGFQISW